MKSNHARELAMMRSAALSPERRREIAQKAARARWKNNKKRLSTPHKTPA